MKTILVVLGTRPEAIKLAPVILELRKNPEYKVLVCNTEQQKELSNQTLGFFNIKADFNLDVMRPNQTLAGVQSRILNALSDVFANNKIDATIVQGDTMTVFCGALVSFYNRVPVFHVEAGLRSYDLFEPFPEEAMRQMAARITDLHFAPTKLAYDALVKENIAPEKITRTGNTVIDALSCLSEIEKVVEEHKKEPHLRKAQILLATEATRIMHGEEGLRSAQAASAALFGGDLHGLSEKDLLSIFKDVPSTTLPAADFENGVNLTDLLVLTKMQPSKGKARAMIAQGGCYVNNEKADNADMMLKTNDLLHASMLVLRCGKKNYHLVTKG